MAKIVFINIPGHGHVNPTLALVQELVRRGHELVYYNTAEFEDKIARTGAEFHAYPEPVPTSTTVAGLLRDGNMAKVAQLMFHTSEQLVPYMLTELGRLQPDFVMHDSIALWGSIAARVLNIPTVASISHFIFDGVDVHRTRREIIHILRSALPVLPDMLRVRRRLIQRYGRHIFQKGHVFPLLGDLNIMYTAESLQPHSTLIDDRFRFVGPSINADVRGAVEFPFDEITRRPLIYLSLGTIHSADTAFYRTAFEAFADHPGQFVMSIGSQIDPGSLGPIPANFIVRSSVPQLRILQQTDAFVTHGGMNSVQEGLYYGVPQVVVPHQMEQLFNARVVEVSGAGVIVGGEPPFGRVRAVELREAVDKVLHTASYRQAARKVSRELTEAGGYLVAADEIEAFAMGLRTGEPEVQI